MALGLRPSTKTELVRSMQEKLNFLTLDEAAEILKVSKRTLHRLIKERKIPAFKIGNQWRIDEARLREWVGHRENLTANGVK